MINLMGELLHDSKKKMDVPQPPNLLLVILVLSVLRTTLTIIDIFLMRRFVCPVHLNSVVIIVGVHSGR